jgi:predicted RNA binding protein YcfA (HicA-like mRNA interferase family)
MKQVSGKDFCRIVERHGWRLMRIAGSHHIYGRGGSIVRLSIPVARQSTVETWLASTPHQAGWTE